MNIVGFIAKYGQEAALIGDALTSMLEGLALNEAQATKVREAIDRLHNASSAIAKAVGSGSAVDKPVVKISKADINAAVKDVLADQVAEAVAKALADRDAAKADDGK